MAGQGWTAQVAAAVGTAAAAGAAQLGLAYGLGVIVWQQAAADSAVWTNSLIWAAWIAATSTILGAVAGGRIGRPAGPRALPSFALATAAAVGALLTIALIAVPARTAVRPDTFSPQTVAAGYAALGVLAGLVIASWAAESRPVATNLLTTIAWVWVLAVIGVVADLVGSRAGGAQLGVWQPTGSDWFFGNLAWPGAVIAVLGALVIGFVVSRVSIRRGDSELGATVSGAVGPLVVALVYLVLAPKLPPVRSIQLSAYLVAPYTVLAGLAGSVLAVVTGRRRRSSSTFRASAPVRLPTGTVSRKAETVKRPPAVRKPAKSGGLFGGLRGRATGRAKAAPAPEPTSEPTPPAAPPKPEPATAGRRGKSDPVPAKAAATSAKTPEPLTPAKPEPTPVSAAKANPKPVDPPITEPTPITGPAPKPTSLTPPPRNPEPVSDDASPSSSARKATRGRGRPAAAKNEPIMADPPPRTEPEPAKPSPSLWVDDEPPADEPENGRRNPFRKLGRRE
jgi:hypothetical protein